MDKIENVDDQVFVNVLRATLNGKISEKVDVFSGWLIGGFGASTLFLAQDKSIQESVTIFGIKCFMYLFLAALLCAIIQKILSVLVSNASTGGLTAHELSKNFGEKGIDLKLEYILNEIEKGVLPIFRKFVSKAFNEAKNGDLVAMSRKISKLCQIQGLFVLIQSLITFLAILIISLSYHV